MTTLAVMKARIADELARSDLTTMIGYAISDAIAAYQDRRFFFTESRDAVTFTTADGQEYYDLSDHYLIPDIFKIDYVKVDVDDVLYDLCRVDAESMEWGGQTANGQPSSYAYYNQQFRLYPIPNDSWDVIVACDYKVEAPASDTETDNPWMTYAERLIRNRAKRELVMMVNASGLDPAFNPNAPMIYEKLEQDAYRDLKGRTNVQLGTGKIKSY